ncbi:MAG: alcohol dehydrogenase catalytic domain-containing protein [Candidatus Hydrothermales bacterium]
MKAAYIENHGGPEVLKIGEINEPEIREGEVKVKVKACSLNHLDIWVRRGLPNLKIQFPHILGSDIAGVIEEIKDENTYFKKNDKVILYPATFCGYCEKCISGKENFCKEYKILGENVKGGNAEYIVVKKELLMPYPSNLSFEEAACLPLTLLTAMQMVKKSKIKPFQTALVMAAGSGVSVMLIQILKALNCYVVAGSSSDDKLKKAKELGADEIINYTDKDWEKKLKGKKIDVIFDHIGKDFLFSLLRISKWGGKIITCGATSGFDTSIDLRYIFFKQISLIGSTMGARKHLLQGINLLNSGKIKPVIDRVLPLEKIKDAHILLEEKKVFGKIVLKVD